MNTLPYVAHGMFATLVVVLVATTEFIVILFGSPLLSSLVDTYLLPGFDEAWSYTPSTFTSAFVAGVLAPYFAKNKWPYSHLLTVMAVATTYYMVKEEIDAGYLIVFIVTSSSMAGLWAGSIFTQKYIRKNKRDGFASPVSSTVSTDKVSSSAIKKVRYLLVGTAIFTAAAFAGVVILGVVEVPGSTTLAGYSRYFLSLGTIMLPYIPLIALTYTSPTYCGGRYATLFYGAQVFLFATIPFLVLIVFAALAFTKEGPRDEFSMLYGVLYIIQWLVVLSVLLRYDIAASLSVYKRVKEYFGIKEAPVAGTSEQQGNGVGYEQAALNLGIHTRTKMLAWVTFGVFLATTIVYWYMAYESPTDRFIRAASEGKNNIVVNLLNEGIDVNAKQSSPKEHRGWTALMWAASNGHPIIIDTLLRNGASVDASNWFNSTPLMAAAQQGSADSVEILLKAGANANAQENDGDSAITVASIAGNTEVVKLLLDAGAYVNVRNSTSYTPLMGASRNGHYHTVKLLLANYADSNAQDDNDWTALMLASKYGHEDIVNELLESGADVDAQNSDGRTSLMVSAYKHNTEIAFELLNHGADVNAKTNEGLTVLQTASGEGLGDLVITLLENNADIDARNTYGHTALIYASLYNHSHIVNVLLSAGADVNLVDEEGKTALIMAAADGNIDSVIILLEAEPELNWKDSEGRTALNYAKMNNHHDIVSILDQAGANE